MCNCCSGYPYGYSQYYPYQSYSPYQYYNYPSYGYGAYGSGYGGYGGGYPSYGLPLGYVYASPGFAAPVTPRGEYRVGNCLMICQ